MLHVANTETNNKQDKKFFADNLLRSKDSDRINSKKATPTPIQVLALSIKLQLIKSISMNELEVVKNMNQIFTNLLH